MSGSPNQTENLPEGWERLAEQAEMIDGGPDDQLVCPRCFDPIQAHAHLCKKCGGPVSDRALIDPFASIWGEGYAYRQVTKVGARPGKLLLIGMWVGFFPGILFYFVLVLMSAKTILDDISGVSVNSSIHFGEIGESLLSLFCMTLMMGLYIAIVRRVTINYLQGNRINSAGTESTEFPNSANYMLAI